MNPLTLMPESVPAPRPLRLTRRLRLVATSLVLTTGASTAVGQSQPLAPLAWLAGCWAAEGGEAGSVEQWLQPAGGTMLGIGRTVKNGKTVAHEFMQIRVNAEGRVIFIALPAGQTESTFVAVTLNDGEVVFENPQHDFPQRVIYRAQPGGRLVARIEGVRRGTPRAIDFPMQRVACDVPGAAAGR